MEINLSSITLRPFRLSDVEDLMTYAGDEQVTQHLRWKTLTTKEEALTFLKDVCIPHPWRRSICIDDHSIGFISVFPWSGDESHKADIGYAISPKYWGQGIASEAVKTAVPQVFKDFPHLLRLQAFANSKNKASQRVLEKAGFQKEGLLRKYGCLKGEIIDLVVYSFLSTD
ncbi:putative ribosomal-protein-alanine N-acetyltransferase [Rosa chinensis]|uniref:Putative ribosomal-protein-alanine N-acetyltransferase n=2 Tax=Rosa chinensis TaxID=74649 RepID=A0A2P6PRG7_ROSCH|nr:putative ribosomal-protein-alanine N-acetyltransferase [Rosa chinensis]